MHQYLDSTDEVALKDSLDRIAQQQPDQGLIYEEFARFSNRLHQRASEAFRRSDLNPLHEEKIRRSYRSIDMLARNLVRCLAPEEKDAVVKILADEIRQSVRANSGRN
ncbi:MAG: hypothetical protein CMO55_24910 [Verrucomicrobiales bacterium]|nr:hypothetical protein [Verrucomicrobiales bacterium]